MTTKKSMHMMVWTQQLFYFEQRTDWEAGTTNSALIDMKTVLINSLDEDICKRIEIWATTTQTTLKFFHQLGAITGLWTRRTDHYGFYWHAQNSRERMKQRSGRIRHSLESKQGRSHVLGRAHNNDMRQIHGENLGHKI